MALKIAPKTFSGSSKVFDGTLANLLRSLAQFQAANIAKGLADITDNSTGTSGGNTSAILALPTAFTSVGTDAAPKAGSDTALSTLRDAITVVASRINVLIQPAIDLDPRTISTGGTIATAGTVPAVTKTVTAVAGSAGTALNFNNSIALLRAYRNELTRLVAATNEVAVAVGLTPINNRVGGDVGTGRTFVALAAATGTAATAPQAAAAGTISKAAMDAYLTNAANIVATCAAKLNAATDGVRVVTPFALAVA